MTTVRLGHLTDIQLAVLKTLHDTIVANKGKRVTSKEVELNHPEVLRPGRVARALGELQRRGYVAGGPLYGSCVWGITDTGQEKLKPNWPQAPTNYFPCDQCAWDAAVPCPEHHK